jgi:hypothetical protein
MLSWIKEDKAQVQVQVQWPRDTSERNCPKVYSMPLSLILALELDLDT